MERKKKALALGVSFSLLWFHQFAQDNKLSFRSAKLWLLLQGTCNATGCVKSWSGSVDHSIWLYIVQWNMFSTQTMKQPQALSLRQGKSGIDGTRSVITAFMSAGSLYNAGY